MFIMNFEVPERYARTVYLTLRHSLKRSVKIISEGNRRSRFTTGKKYFSPLKLAKRTLKPERYFFNHALKRSEKIIFRRKIGEAGS